jgi:hypothetical protein
VVTTMITEKTLEETPTSLDFVQTIGCLINEKVEKPRLLWKTRYVDVEHGMKSACNNNSLYK